MWGCDQGMWVVVYIWCAHHVGMRMCEVWGCEVCGVWRCGGVRYIYSLIPRLRCPDLTQVYLVYMHIPVTYSETVECQVCMKRSTCRTS